MLEVSAFTIPASGRVLVSQRVRKEQKHKEVTQRSVCEANHRNLTEMKGLIFKPLGVQLKSINSTFTFSFHWQVANSS